MNKRWNPYQMAGIGLMAALVFVSNYISIPIPSGPSVTRVHVANAFCLLSGLLLGPVGGGLSAGIGSFLYDLTNPAYISGSPFTFVFKFLLAFVCAKIAYTRGNKAGNVKLNFIAAISGSLTYIVLYLGKTFVENIIVYHLALPANLGFILTDFITSSINATIAVLLSVPLCLAIRKALKRGNLLEKLQ